MSRTTVTLTIEILSYWHAGSGIGQGADADALVLKDRFGLPYLPGRTVKGLLREGLQTCEDAGPTTQVAAWRTNALFGKPAAKGTSDSSKPGLLTFDSAVLGTEDHDYLVPRDRAGLREAMFDRFASTAIDDHGMAENKTLRVIELCVPVVLTASVTGPATDTEWVGDLKKACSMVRCLGSHRNRGLGRCRLSIGKNKEAAHA